MRRHTIFAALAIAGLAGLLLGTQAHAQVTACRKDPIIKFSNGKQLDVVATIGNAATDVSKVTYAVKIPTGVSVTSVIYTGGTSAGNGSVTVSATNAGGTYATATRVTTVTTKSTVTVTATLLSRRLRSRPQAIRRAATRATLSQCRCRRSDTGSTRAIGDRRG